MEVSQEDNKQIPMGRREIFVRSLFAAFALLVVIDLIAITVDRGYRDLFGPVGTIWSNQFGLRILPDIWSVRFGLRILPDVLLLAFYAVFEFQVRRRRQVSRGMVLTHAVVFLFIGTLASIPMVGAAAVIFTPISSLYFGTIILIPDGTYLNGVYLSFAIAPIFFLLNVCLLVLYKLR